MEPKKLSDKKLILSAIENIEKDTGFHIIDLEFGTYYYESRNKTCSFHIKEIPNFLFALWNTKLFGENTKNYNWGEDYHISSNSELCLFFQYEPTLDKFKPSRSTCFGLYRDKYETENEDGEDIWVEEWNTYHLRQALIWMHKHPIKARVHDVCRDKYIWESKSPFKILKYYIEIHYDLWKYRQKNKMKDKEELRISKKICHSLKSLDYMILDYSDNWSPRYHINICFPNTSDPKILEEQDKDDKKADELYEKYMTYVDIDSFCDETCDTFYKKFNRIVKKKNKDEDDMKLIESKINGKVTKYGNK